jgi:hypothetical protein
MNPYSCTPEVSCGIVQGGEPTMDSHSYQPRSRSCARSRTPLSPRNGVTVGVVSPYRYQIREAVTVAYHHFQWVSYTLIARHALAPIETRELTDLSRRTKRRRSV